MSWEDWKEGELRRIPIDIVHPSTILPERSYTKELTGDIHQPILVRKSPLIEGYFEIWDGHKRWLKLRDQNAEEIDARFYDLTNDQVFERSLAVNDEHDTTTAYGKAEHYEMWMKDIGVETQKEFAEKAGLSEATVSVHMSILDLVKMLRKFTAVNFETIHALSKEQYEELFRLWDYPESLVSIWRKLEKNPDIRGKELTKLVDNELPEEAEEEKEEEAEEEPEEEEEERPPKRKPKRKPKEEEEEGEEVGEEVIKLSDFWPSANEVLKKLKNENPEIGIADILSDVILRYGKPTKPSPTVPAPTIYSKAVEDSLRKAEEISKAKRDAILLRALELWFEDWKEKLRMREELSKEEMIGMEDYE